MTDQKPTGRPRRPLRKIAIGAVVAVIVIPAMALLVAAFGVLSMGGGFSTPPPAPPPPIATEIPADTLAELVGSIAEPFEVFGATATEVDSATVFEIDSDLGPLVWVRIHTGLTGIYVALGTTREISSLGSSANSILVEEAHHALLEAGRS